MKDDDEIDQNAVQNPAKAKQDELTDVSNRFGSVMTNGDTLATFSKGLFE